VRKDMPQGMPRSSFDRLAAVVCEKLAVLR
jgi:hypothetical protein